MTMDDQVSCPICGQTVPASQINAHIDANCPPVTKTATTSPLKTQQSRLSLSGTIEFPEKRTVNSSEKSPTQPQRMAPLFTPQSKRTDPSPSSSNSSHLSTSSMKRPANEQSQGQNNQPDPPSTKRQKRDPALESMPLAAKVRPSSLSEFVGQEELLGEKGVLKALMQYDRIPSMILWGPPGCGKTTIARIISKTTKSRFIELSATSHGASDVKKAFDEARGHLTLTGQKTIIFIDEIHRFTKAQQDLFLPYVEQGTIHLIGATTENPSFKVNSALLSRCRVFVLKRLTEDQLVGILSRALRHWRCEGQEQQKEDREEEKHEPEEEEALRYLANFSDGDARNALNTLEVALSVLPSKDAPLKTETIKGAFQKSHLLYDRNGEEHYNVISALHKSIRGSDADAALYWLGRMLEAGEDPLYVARRLVRCASEDIGLADNSALPLAVAAYQACERIGMPECDTILAHLVTYLAETKKSVRTYNAYNLVKETIRQEPNYPVPLHIRNAPTKLMKDVGYGKGYKYNPDYDEPVDQTYLPDELKTRKFLDQDIK